MKTYRLRNLVFLALCCDLGLFSKRLIAPAANVITDFLRIPGGIGTSFSLMFLIVAAELVPYFGCATLMGAVQSILALSLGMVGSMGAFSPIAYIVPGFVIDCVFYIFRKMKTTAVTRCVTANMLSAAAASLTANFLVFHLWGPVLALYCCVGLLSGAFCGVLGAVLAKRLKPALSAQEEGNRANRAAYEGKEERAKV